MGKISTIVHWSSFVYYVYVFGYASLFKVFQKTSMMDTMKNLGFNEILTTLIGTGELLGVIGLLYGLYKSEYKNLAILWLFPFAVGALIAHMAHQDYNHLTKSLTMCILSIVLLATDKDFKIILKAKV